MRESQVKAHKDVRDWWLKNTTKGVWHRDYLMPHSPKWKHTLSPSFNPNQPHVQNDEYAELRMALVDSKIVQYFIQGDWEETLKIHSHALDCSEYYRIKPQHYMDISNKVQVYLEDYSKHGLNKLFDKAENYRYVFRHSDCPIVFTTDGLNIFAMDMDNKEYELFKNGDFNLYEYYNDFNEFLLQFELIERIIGQTIFLSNWSGTHRVSIASLRQSYIRPKEQTFKVGDWVTGPDDRPFCDPIQTFRVQESNLEFANKHCWKWKPEESKTLICLNTANHPIIMSYDEYKSQTEEYNIVYDKVIPYKGQPLKEMI